jgi:hypothetical protein
VSCVLLQGQLAGKQDSQDQDYVAEASAQQEADDEEELMFLQHKVRRISVDELQHTIGGSNWKGITKGLLCIALRLNTAQLLHCLPCFAMPNPDLLCCTPSDPLLFADPLVSTAGQEAEEGQRRADPRPLLQALAERAADRL